MTPTLLISFLLLPGSLFQQRIPKSLSLTTAVLPGQVVVAGGGSLPIIWPKLYVFAASSDADKFVVQEDRSIRVQGHGAVAPVGSDGTFRLRLSDGVYTVTLVTGLGRGLPDGYSVQAIVLGARDVLKQKLQVPAPADQSLRITIKPSGNF